MQVLFDGEIHVHYGFLWFDASGGSGFETDLMDARAGQVNGLLGAVEPGVLSMVTGMHTGLIPVRVELLDAAPPMPGDWLDVVEASIDVRDTRISLSAFDSSESFELPAPGWHRARWSDTGMTEARETERYESNEPVVERCLLQLWPGPPAPDTIVRETSSFATYWHQEARSARRAPTPHERALAEEQARVDRVRQEREWEQAEELRRWGGRDPSPHLRRAAEPGSSLIRDHRDLVDALEAIGPAAQRALTLELTRAACAAADGAPLDWAPALEALARSAPLPPPFDDAAAANRAAFPVDRTVTYAITVAIGGFDDRPARQPLHPVSAAVGAVLAAGRPDPLAAVLGTVEAASWSAPDLVVFFDQIAARIRELSAPSW